jgi:hypothetical protein
VHICMYMYIYMHVYTYVCIYIYVSIYEYIFLQYRAERDGASARQVCQRVD